MQALVDSHLQTEEQFRETDRRLKELGEKTDERIAKLVSAIGELISRIPPAALSPKG
jgi:predicted  nucleic acid-binding Zn-ribbon protein